MDSTTDIQSEHSDDDNSDDTLKIVIESPSKRKKFVPNESDKQIIDEVEEYIEDSLEEKASKINLKAKDVKSILKHVVTNEHVLALVRQAEHPEEADESILVYEPKLTRAKVKSLANVPNPLLVSPNTKKKSETHVLISGDLPEDSSDDEYVPGEEESEDDRDSSVLSESDPLSVPPMTPPTPLSQDLLETSYTDDGVFKIPPTKTTSEVSDATIALRTRSKLCLSSTPLEIIEEKFIPPDITTDMYDMDCDDDDWRDFLKKFTRPLDEITRAAEDEEHDPEYNILADEEIDEVDKEELRMDKAVKVSRKELNDLMSELFAYADIFSRNDKENTAINISTPVPDLDPSLQECQQECLKQNLEEPEEVDSEPVMIEKDQIPLLEQQLRQHVQLLTQNFLLAYCHPEIHEFSSKCKEYLLNLKFLGDGKERSMFHVYNLPGALELVDDWTNKWYTNSPEIKQLKSHVEGDIAESIKRKNVGTQHISTLAPLIMETISNSDVFIYTSLLPKVPYKSKTVYSSKHITFCDAEDSLIALGIEQFSSFPPENKGNGNQKSSEITLLGVAKLISEHMMPTKTAKQVFTRIKSCRLSRCASNPIKTYYQTKKIAPLIHYVYPLDTMKVIPPCQRNPDDLPYQIKTYLQTQKQKTGIMSENVTVPTITLTPVVNFVEPQPVITSRNILPQPHKYIRLNHNIFNPTNSVITSTPIKQSVRINQPIKYKTKKIIKVRNVATQETPPSKTATPLEIIIKIFKRPPRSEKILKLFQRTNGLVDLTGQVADMLPSMPNLNTPIKKNPQEKTHDQPGPSHNQNILKNLVQDLSIQSTSNEEDHSQEVVEIESKIDVSEVTLTGAGAAENSTVNNVKAEKDNLDDINALMVASSTVKPSTKKEPSGAEKKRAKTRREFLANLAICTPEDPEITTQKSERFAMAYYDKLRETLELNDYHQIMHILNEFEGVDTIDLYYKVEGVLRPKYNELAEEFLLFLKEKEAAAVGKLIPWIQMNTRSKFLKKMEIYFKDQPAQLRKIFKCLTELSETMDVTMDKVKTTLIPMLKGNTQLVDLFLQNFLNETPPKSLMEGCYEIIDVNKEMARPQNEEHYESIVIPTEDDVYGSSSCVCSCHQIEDPEFKTRHRHCIPCGTKFIQGKVYIQTGRGLRPATVSFLTNSNKDHNVRLNGKSSTNSRRKRSETSPSKQVFVSPSKDNGDEESEDEVDGKKKSKTKTPRKRKKQPDKKGAKEPAKSGKASEKTEPNVPAEKPIKKRLISKKSSKEVKNFVGIAQSNEQEDVKPNIEPESKPGANPGQLKRLPDENAEWDYSVSTESVELKTSPQTAESESEFCEESSQDNCESDSNLSCSSGSNTQSDAGEELHWRRDEDKIILETFQKENDKEHAFTLIANKLKDRSVSQIRNRFQTLMTLLMEQLD